MRIVKASSPVARHKALEAIWRTPAGWGRLTAVNHTVIGRRFIVTAAIYFAIGGLLAMMIRAQLADPKSAFVGPEIYGQLFTMHGTVMMFLFAIPMLEGWAMYLLPKMLGARDMAFPRLSAYGYWCYLFGGAILIVALLAGYAPSSGWFMYTPLSSQPFSPGINADVWLIGVTFVEISAISAAIEIPVTILKLRAPGMSLARMPIYAWYMLVTAFMMLAGFPPLILGSVLLETERAFGWPFFDPTRGGDPLLWQHLFWLFGHPEVYIIFLPAAGLVSMMVPVLARTRLVGYSWIVVSIVALGIVSFGLWAHHMFAAGIAQISLVFFSAASLLVAVPTAVQLFAWLVTLASGTPRMSLPMLYMSGFLTVFVIGGLTGVMLAIVPFNWQAHDTHFVVAHLHYVLIGGFVFPTLAAAYFWLPHFTGRLPLPVLGRAAFWLIFSGVNLTFLVMHITGLRGMPRRIDNYVADFGWSELNLLSSVGGFVTAMGFALFATDMLLQPRFGKRFRRNPWQAHTLEWAMPTPPAAYGFAAIPSVSSREPLLDDPDLPRQLSTGAGYLGFARAGRQETIGVTLAGEPESVVILPSRTLLPLWLAIATGIFFLAVLFKLYMGAIAGAGAVVIAAWLWTRQSGTRMDKGHIEAGMGLCLPQHLETVRPPAWWGMFFLLIADAIFFVSLAFSLAYLKFAGPELATSGPPGVQAAWLIVPGLAASMLVSFAGRRALHHASRQSCAWLWLGLAATGMVLAILWLLMLLIAPDPTLDSQTAARAALLATAGFHMGVSALLMAYSLSRIAQGYVSKQRRADLSVPALWHDASAMVCALTLILAVVS